MAFSFLSPKVLWSKLWGRGPKQLEIDEGFEKLYRYSMDGGKLISVRTDVSRQADESDGEGCQCLQETTLVVGQAMQSARSQRDDGKTALGGHGSEKDRKSEPDVERGLRNLPSKLQTTGPDGPHR